MPKALQWHFRSPPVAVVLSHHSRASNHQFACRRQSSDSFHPRQMHCAVPLPKQPIIEVLAKESPDIGVGAVLLCNALQ